MSNELKYHLYGIEALLWIIIFWVTPNEVIKIVAVIGMTISLLLSGIYLFIPRKNASVSG